MSAAQGFWVGLLLLPVLLSIGLLILFWEESIEWLGSRARKLWWRTAMHLPFMQRRWIARLRPEAAGGHPVIAAAILEWKVFKRGHYHLIREHLETAAGAHRGTRNE